MVSTLSYDQVLAIHGRVVQDFADDADPVGLSGPRDRGRLLESVVWRQEVGMGDVLKYPDPLTNAATLAFGLCCGHPFHNGNKRTALVAMLAHLDRNGLTVFGVRQNELYKMIKAVATHTLGVRPDPRNKRHKYSEREADTEVAAIAAWLKLHARPYERGERILTYKQLRKVLRGHGLELANPKKSSIGVYRTVERRKGLTRRTVTEQKHIATIHYAGDNRIIGERGIKSIRRACKLDAAHGYDSAAFYDAADVIDVFIDEYRTILSRLARQ
jgi:death-on-curing protein